MRAAADKISAEIANLAGPAPSLGAFFNGLSAPHERLEIRLRKLAFTIDLWDVL